MIYCDTHLIVWLYEGRLELVPAKAQQLLEQSELLISPMVTLELQYLFEIGKISVTGKSIVDDLSGRIGLATCHQSFEHVIDQSLREVWTRDPFDRIIVAQARLRNLPLLTKDKTIHKHYPRARWDI